jgi:hypothetical protein
MRNSADDSHLCARSLRRSFVRRLFPFVIGSRRRSTGIQMLLLLCDAVGVRQSADCVVCIAHGTVYPYRRTEMKGASSPRTKRGHLESKCHEYHARIG